MEHYAGRVVFLYEMKHYMLGPVASVGEEGRGQTPFILRLKCGRRNKKIGDAKKGRKERKWGGRGGKEKEKGRETEKEKGVGHVCTSDAPPPPTDDSGYAPVWDYNSCI